MRQGIQGFGWFIRRSEIHEQLVPFYRDVLGFPVLRTGNLTAFWTGELTVLEVSYGGAPVPHFRDRSEAPLTPIYRVASMERTVARLNEAGAKFLHEPYQPPDSHFSYVRDPAGNLVGLAERPRTSTTPDDVEAWRRWDAGKPTLEGSGPLPEDMQSLGWVVLRGADIDGLAAFWRDVVGLDYLRDSSTGKVFSMGDLVRLEIAPGCEPQAAPSDRMEVSNSFLLRVDNCSLRFAQVKAAGARVVNEPISIPGGQICYFSDPEGHVFGFQSRNSESTRPEDYEAVRRAAKPAR